MLPVVKYCLRSNSHRNAICPRIIKSCFKSYTPSSINSNADDLLNESGLGEKKNISKAMRAYLQRAKEYEAFMKKEKFEFEVGKRHLANMMGEDPEMFTQEDVDRAIEYLFPSGIFDPKARPTMKPPEDIYPPQKAAEFDVAGRPHHFLFYTGRSNFFKLLYDMYETLDGLNKFEDIMIKKQLTPDPTQTLNVTGTDWLPQDVLEHRVVEKIHEKEYKAFQNILNRIVSHPYAYRAKDFIEQYRQPLTIQKFIQDVPELLHDENGRPYITTTNCLRKRAWAEVTVRGLGSGKITINGKGLDYFQSIQSREQIIFPLIFSNMLKKVDVEAVVKGGGVSGQAGAIRWGISICLRSFVDSETMEKMRIAGLLTRDYRKPERKKPGQEGARRKYTWKKR